MKKRKIVNLGLGIFLLGALTFGVAAFAHESHDCNDHLNGENKIVHEHSHNEDQHFSIEITGKAMKELTIQQIADLWEIDSNILLDSIKEEFDLDNEYTIDNILEDLRVESKFSPAQIKAIAEIIKKEIK